MVLFEGFERKRIDVGDAAIHLVKGGDGPPLLLLHGYPQSHACWHLVAPRLAERFTVVCTDLTGYGDSSVPEDGDEHARYSKRHMARDQLAVMAALGFERFGLIGHDRGGRVALRLALDHPEAVSRAAFLDIIPTIDMWERMDKKLSLDTYHWMFLAQPYDLPERLILGAPDYYLRWTMDSWANQPGFYTAEAFDAYARCFRDPASLHAMCEDYRAGAGIDLEHDAADRSSKLTCPVLVLWGGGHALERPFDFEAVWKTRADDLRVTRMPCGHFMPEEAPEDTVRELAAFFA